MKNKKKTFFKFSKKKKHKGSKNEDLFIVDTNEIEEDYRAKKSWIEEEEEDGELLVDVYQKGSDIVIRSTVAGVKSDDLDIDINNDMVTIRGKRKESSQIEEEDYYYKECYWGGFSRSIILPCEVQANKSKATLKDGVLVLILPKSEEDKVVKVAVQDK